MIYCVNNSLKKLYDLVSLKSSNNKEEEAFLKMYDSLKENESLLLLTQEIQENVEQQLKGNYCENSEHLKSILQYAFVNDFTNYSEIDMYLFSHIKSYAIAHESQLNNNPFESCYLDVDRIFRDLNIDNRSIDFKYNFIKNSIERLSNQMLNITMVKSFELELKLEDSYQIKVIDNIAIPSLDRFKHGIANKATSKLFGFSCNVQLRDTFMHSIYSLDHWDNHHFHIMSEKVS